MKKWYAVLLHSLFPGGRLWACIVNMVLPHDSTEYIVCGRSASLERKIWIVPTAMKRPTLAAVFMDAELYRERVDAAAVIKLLHLEGHLPPTASAFVSHHSAAARHTDFTCAAEYTTFIAEDVTAWVRERFPSIQSIVLAGLSLSGLAAAFAATQYQHAFAAAICQSPSFWWQDGWFFKNLASATGTSQKLWISVGEQETDSDIYHSPSNMFQKLTQVEACDAASAALQQGGYEVRYRKFAGGHDPSCWRDDLVLALPWACGIRG